MLYSMMADNKIMVMAVLSPSLKTVFREVAKELGAGGLSGLLCSDCC